MEQQSSISTSRLVMRPFTLDDAAEVRYLAGNKAIAATTLNIPHPYEEGIAEAWIGSHRERFENREAAIFAVTQGESGLLMGSIGVVVKEHDRGEMGYWMGQPYWNNGYTTEAARAIIAFSFRQFMLNKVTASHLAGNSASGRVMEKAGMKYEGCSPQHVKKWGQYEDLVFYGILKEDFESMQS
jgi:ribosomal-protein-alanine N-acetyltransferase